MAFPGDPRRVKTELSRIFEGDIPHKVEFKPEEIQKIRRSKRLSQNDVFKKCGVSPTHQSRLENGKVESTDTFTLYELSIGLECKFGEIAKLDDTPSAILTPPELERAGLILRQELAVKTLLRPHEEIDVKEVYYPVRLSELTGASEGRIYSRLQDFSTNQTAILGRVGNGKSVYLKSVAVNEIEAGELLPVFIELRNFKVSGTLVSQFRETLNRMGIRLSSSNLDSAMAHGLVAIFLDALDEAPLNAQVAIMDEVDTLRIRYPELRFLISSRPQSPIAQKPWLPRYKIVDLRENDVAGLIEKYAENGEARRLITQLPSLRSGLSDLLTTPLLVVMLVLHFRYTASIPESTLAFYKDLISVLLTRHNTTDTGLKHEPKSGCKPGQLRLYFQALCYVVHRDLGNADVLTSDMELSSQKAVSLCDFEASPFDALEDIANITNLVVEDEGRFHFLHSSVREFNAAAFIASASNRNATRFYSRLSENSKWKDWIGVLSFLEKLDRFRYSKLFMISDLKKSLPSREDMLATFSTLRFSGWTANKTPYVVVTDSLSFSLRDDYFSFTPKSMKQIADLVGESAFESVVEQLKQGGAAELDISSSEVDMNVLARFVVEYSRKRDRRLAQALDRLTQEKQAIEEYLADDAGHEDAFAV